MVKPCKFSCCNLHRTVTITSYSRERSNMSKLLLCTMMDSSAMLCRDTYTVTYPAPAGACITQLVHASFAISQVSWYQCNQAVSRIGRSSGNLTLGAISPLLPLSQELSCMGLHLLSWTLSRGQVVDPGRICHLELWACYVHSSIKNFFTGWEHIPHQSPNQIKHYRYFKDIIPGTCIFQWLRSSSKLGFKIGC